MLLSALAQSEDGNVNDSKEGALGSQTMDVEEESQSRTVPHDTDAGGSSSPHPAPPTAGPEGLEEVVEPSHKQAARNDTQREKENQAVEVSRAVPVLGVVFCCFLPWGAVCFRPCGQCVVVKFPLSGKGNGSCLGHCTATR